MLREMALQMIGGFVVVYMYQLGYSLQFIAIYLLLYFLLRTALSPLVALIVAHVGPKHGTLLSHFGHILAAFILVFIPEYGLPALIVYAPIAGLSTSLYIVCYLVDFSKVKHVDHAGKELGIMQVVERIMTSLGPLAGGAVALFFGPQAMFVFASGLLLVAAMPLFFTSEPVKTHQKITLKHFNWKIAWKPMLGNIGVGVDMNISGIMWKLFLAITVLGVAANTVYVQIGALSSITMFASIACAYFYGKLVDRHQGTRLLKLSVIANTLLHIVRSFVSTPVQAIGINIANEVTSTGCNLPATRGIFDTADGLPGYRIVYMTIMGAMLSFGDAIAMAVLIMLTSYFDTNQSLHLLFFVLAPVTLLIWFHTSALYHRGVLTKFIHRV